MEGACTKNQGEVCEDPFPEIDPVRVVFACSQHEVTQAHKTGVKVDSPFAIVRIGPFYLISQAFDADQITSVYEALERPDPSANSCAHFRVIIPGETEVQRANCFLYRTQVRGERFGDRFEQTLARVRTLRISLARDGIVGVLTANTPKRV